MSQSIDTIRRGKCENGFAPTPRAAPQRAEQLAVDDPELEPELLAHLVAPLQLQAGRADDERGPRAVAQDQLLDDEAGLDRLAEADVVGDQQRGARHPQRAHEGFELVVLDRDAAAKRGLQRLLVGAGDRAPAHGIEERVERRGVVDVLGADRRQLGALDDLRPGLDLPDDLELLARRVVLDRDQGHEVLDLPAVERRLRIALHLGDDPLAAADAGELAGLGGGRGGCSDGGFGECHCHWTGVGVDARKLTGPSTLAHAGLRSLPTADVWIGTVAVVLVGDRGTR